VSAGPVRLRRVRTAEWARLRELRLRALRTDPLAFGSTLRAELELSEPHWRDRARSGATAPETATWVAEQGGDLVGLATLARTPNGPQLFGMWVDPVARGRGVGGKLLDSLLEWARKTWGPGPIRLEVNPDQGSAVRLYRSRGFQFVSGERGLAHAPGALVRPMVLATNVGSSAREPVTEG